MFWCTRFKREKKKLPSISLLNFSTSCELNRIGKMLQVALEERTGVFLLLHLLYFLFSLLSSLRKVPRLEKPKKKGGNRSAEEEEEDPALSVTLVEATITGKQRLAASAFYPRGRARPPFGPGQGWREATTKFRFLLSGCVCVCVCVYTLFYHPPSFAYIPSSSSSFLGDFFFSCCVFVFTLFEGGVGGVGVGDRSGCLERARAAKKRENFGMV